VGIFVGDEFSDRGFQAPCYHGSWIWWQDLEHSWTCNSSDIQSQHKWSQFWWTLQVLSHHSHRYVLLLLFGNLCLYLILCSLISIIIVQLFSLSL